MSFTVHTSWYAIADLNCILQLDYVASNCAGVICSSSNTVVIKYEVPRCQVYVYPTKLMCIDADDEIWANVALKMVTQNIHDIGYTTVHLSNFRTFVLKPPKIQNIVATVDLQCVLDLQHIASHSFNVVYNPIKFNALTMRLRNPKASANIFTSGKMMCLGTTDEENARIATRKFARIIQKLGFPINFHNFHVVNIVGSTDLGFKPIFDRFYYENIDRVFFNQEVFSGMYYTSGETKVTLFRSGKVTMTGIKTREQMYDVYKEFFQKTINSST